MKDHSTDYYYDVQTDGDNKRKTYEQSRVRLTVGGLGILHVNKIKYYIKVILKVINRPSQVAYEQIEYFVVILIGRITFTIQ